MLESAELRHTLDEQAFHRDVEAMRVELVLAQYALHESQRGPVIVLLSGLAGGVRSGTLAHLTEWLDPRFVRAVAFRARTPEERAHPAMWRYWQALPPRGRIGIFFGAWYNDALRVGEGRGPGAADAVLVRIRELEQMLADEGVRFVKVWLHMRREDLDARLDAVAREKLLPKRMLRDLRERARRYYRHLDVAEHLLRETSIASAPWHVVEGYDPRYRDTAVARLVLHALKDRAGDLPSHREVAMPPVGLDNTKRLRDLDLSLALSDERYDEAMPDWQRRLAKRIESKAFSKR